MDKDKASIKKESDIRNNQNYSVTTTVNSPNSKKINRSTPKLTSSLAKNHLYINNKSNLKAQLKHCENLLNSGVSDIYLHALGNTIAKAANLGLILVRNSNGALSYEANTSTVDIFDDILPLDDEIDFSVDRRLNSCLHIKISTNINFE